MATKINYDRFTKFEKMHTLLRLAIDDVKAVKEMAGYVLSGKTWMTNTGSTCVVCAAGAVLVKSGLDRNTVFNFKGEPEDSQKALQTTDYL